MAELYALLFFVLLLIGLAAYFLSTQLYRRMIRKGSANARRHRIAAFILGFFVICIAVAFYIIFNNVKFMC
jgi:predicted PurR-regulated permease PerM